MSDVPEGYRMSEVGVIPEVWEVKQFGDFAYLSKNHLNPQHSKKSYPCVELEHLTQETGLLLGFVESKEQLSQKLIFSRGDVLFGKLRPYLKKFYFAEFDGVCTSEIWVIKSYNNAIGQFIFHLIQSNHFLETANQTSGTKMPRADWKIVSCTLFPLPPLPEQQAIASALSDVDALIAALGQLITKKRNIKQGAMQQLLTGEKRLPGFGGVWEVKRLGEIADIISGGTPSTKISEFWNGGIKWCTPTDITRTKQKYLLHTEKNISEKGLKNSSATLLPVGALLLCSRATIGEIRIAKDVVCTNQGFKSLVCKNSFNNQFVYYLLLQSKQKLMDKAIGSTFLEISKKDTDAIELTFPPLPEQQAIAQILSDIDTEIEALEQKQAKYKAIKQGMMQELLTGKTRLV